MCFGAYFTYKYTTFFIGISAETRRKKTPWQQLFELFVIASDNLYFVATTIYTITFEELVAKILNCNMFRLRALLK